MQGLELLLKAGFIPIKGHPGKRSRLDLAMCSTLFLISGKPVRWYPDRKYLLLGNYLAASSR